MTIKQALVKASQKLNKAKIKSAALDAEILLAFALKKTKEYLHTHPEKKLTSNQLKKYNSLINRRAKLEPVAYLINHKEFFGLGFYVDKNVLIPRPETETLVEEALKIAYLPRRRRRVEAGKLKAKSYKLIDIGTGSGCIAVALAKNLPKAKIIAIDSSSKALKIAKKNARINKVSKRIKFIKSNLLTASQLSIVNCQLLTANLPYLTPAQYKQNPELKHEPKNALVAGPDGLKYYRQLFHQISKQYSHEFANNSHKLVIEIDPSQTFKIKKLIKKYHPESKIQIKKDLSGLDRVVIASLAS